jgi:hypothetical protein
VPLSITEWNLSPERDKIFDILVINANRMVLVATIRPPDVDIGLFTRYFRKPPLSAESQNNRTFQTLHILVLAHHHCPGLIIVPFVGLLNLGRLQRKEEFPHFEVEF